MKILISENSFDLKLNRNNLISNYSQFIEALPKFRRSFLITYFYSNNSTRKSILTFENPKSELKKHLLNNQKFLLVLKNSLSEENLTKIQIEICKTKLY